MTHKILFVLCICLTALLFTSCTTAFQAAQPARTIPDNNLQVEFSAGFFEAGVGVDYGITDKLEVGAYCKSNLYFPLHSTIPIMYEADVKYNFFDSEKFALSSGAGIGMGSEYILAYIYNENYSTDSDAEHSPAWFSSPIPEVFVPLYMSFYSNDVCFFVNPFMLYRLENEQNSLLVDTNGINTGIIPGISIGFNSSPKKKRTSFTAAFTSTYMSMDDVEFKNRDDEFSAKLFSTEVLIGLSYRFDLSRKKEKD